MKMPEVNRERDQFYGLASYLMAHGGGTYFGFGLHPYTRVTELWFDAIRVDLGEPKSEYRQWPSDEPASSPGPNLLRNGSLDSLTDWRTAEGIAIDTTEKHEGTASVRLESTDPKAIRIHSQNVTLKPHTTYTLSAWIKTKAMRGGIGAQVYPYDFTKASTAPVAMLSVTGTAEWTRHEMSFTTTDDAEGRISFRISDALGAAWFDDVRLNEGASAPSPQVFIRSFTKGIVFVRPPEGSDLGDSMAIQLPTPLKLLRADGSMEVTVSSITLRKGEAAILLKP